MNLIPQNSMPFFFWMKQPARTWIPYLLWFTPETLLRKKNRGRIPTSFDYLSFLSLSFRFSSLMTCTHNQPTCFKLAVKLSNLLFPRRNTSTNWSEQLCVSVLWTTMDWPPVSNSPTLNRRKGTVYLNGSRKIYWENPGLISWKPRALVKYVIWIHLASICESWYVWIFGTESFQYLWKSMWFFGDDMLPS